MKQLILLLVIWFPVNCFPQVYNSIETNAGDYFLVLAERKSDTRTEFEKLKFSLEVRDITDLENISG